MKLREITSEKDWNPLLIDKTAPFTQGWFYGEWQERLGRKVLRFNLEEAGEVIGCFQVIKYPWILGKAYFYIPYGPIYKEEDKNKILEFLSKELPIYFQKEKGVFCRLDFYPKIKDEKLEKYFRLAPKNTYHAGYFQPRTDWVIDIRKDLTEILKGFSNRAHYNIKLAERKGVKIKIIDKGFSEYTKQFYGLFRETAERDNFKTNNFAYYKNVFELGEKYKNMFLAIAEFEGKTIAMGLINIYGEVAFYLLGASGGKYRNLKAADLLQQEAIKKAKEMDAKIYDFGAVSSEDDPYQSWEGFSAFKRKFGGFERKYSPFYDLVLEPFWYEVYKLVRSIRK